jgi:hypothetical protein
MAVLFLVLLIAAFLCFLAANFNVAAPVNLVALGLAFWVLVFVIQYGRALTP